MPPVSEREHPSGLTVRGQAAVEHYLVHGSQTEAYEAAFGRGRCKPKVFDAMVRRFFTGAKVVAEVQRRREAASARTNITQDMIVQRLAQFAFTDLPGIIDYDGHVMTVEQFKRLTPQQRAAIKKFEYQRDPPIEVKDAEGNVIQTLEGECKVKVELEDRVQCTVKLGQHIGMWEKKPKQAILDKPIIVFQGMPA